MTSSGCRPVCRNRRAAGQAPAQASDARDVAEWRGTRRCGMARIEGELVITRVEAAAGASRPLRRGQLLADAPEAPGELLVV